MDKTILIFKGNNCNDDVLNSSLNRNGFKLINANSYEMAYSAVCDHNPDLMIMDSDARNENNIDVFKLFRESPNTSALPVLLLVSSVDEIEEIAHTELIPDEFIIKPVVPKLLHAKVKSFFYKSANIQKKHEELLNDFKSRISLALPHEFRTSLSGILGYSRLIAEQIKGNIINHQDIEDVYEMAVAINSEGRRLHKLTENFLMYSQLQAIISSKDKQALLGNSSIDNPEEIISDIVNDFKVNMKSNHIFYTQTVEATIHISYYYFYTIVYELIDNAIKFSQAGSDISIQTFISDKSYHLIIQDYGIGMSKEQIKNISAYNQYDRSYHEQQGTGLGLFIAKILVELHKGVFSIDSSLGKGTNITIQFPIYQNK